MATSAWPTAQRTRPAQLSAPSTPIVKTVIWSGAATSHSAGIAAATGTPRSGEWWPVPERSTCSTDHSSAITHGSHTRVAMPAESSSSRAPSGGGDAVPPKRVAAVVTTRGSEVATAR